MPRARGGRSGEMGGKERMKVREETVKEIERTGSGEQGSETEIEGCVESQFRPSVCPTDRPLSEESLPRAPRAGLAGSPSAGALIY